MVGLSAGLVACDNPARTPRPSPSLITLDFTPRPSATVVASPTPGTSVATWPLGWDEDFCSMFTQAVDAQQLLVDVQKDIADGNDHDAQLLADELVQSANGSRDAVGSIADWSDGNAAVVAVAGLMDLASRSGTEYQAWFTDGKSGSLRRAKDLRLQNGAAVPDVNTSLAALTDTGLSCQNTPLVLEAPG